MPKYHSRLETVLIHFVTIVFTFFSLASAFLGYGIYKNNQQDFTNQPLISIGPTPTQAAGPTNSLWTQSSWTGGTSSSTFAVTWSSNGGWDKYSSAVNADISSSGIREGGDGSSQLVSNIFDLGTKRLSGISTKWGGETIQL